MQRSQVLAIATVALLVLVPGATVAATSDHLITGNPGIDISVPDNEVRPGEQTALDVVLINDGNVTNGSISNPQLESQVTTARAVKVRVEDEYDAPVTVNTNEQALARLPDGASAPVRFALTVDRDAAPGTYELPVNVTYNYTRSVDPQTSEYNRTQTSKTFDVSLVVRETAQFAVVDVTSNARVGATGTVNVTLRNTGYEVARNASVALTSQNTDLTFGQSPSASRYVGGSWAPGETRTVSYRVEATRSASQQRYAFSSQVTYENTDGNTRQSRSLSLGVTPEREQAFTVVSTNNSVAVGDDGTVNVTLRNDGPITVRDAAVTLQSTSGDVVFGQSASASQYLGTWAPGETRTVQVDATAVPDAATRNYSIRTTVAYEDREGDPGQSRTLQFGLRPAPEVEYEFAASEVSSDLRVGEEGTISGTIENTGDAEATSVVVVLDTESDSVSPLDRTYSVGALAPGETAQFEFDVEVSDSGEAGPRQFTFHTEFRDSDDDQRRGDSFDVRQQLRPARDVFATSVGGAAVERGGTTLLNVTVTNNANETLSDISGKLFADSPVSVDDDEAFVGELAPGESTTLVYQISAGGSALAKAYPVEIDFQYDESDGDRKLSDTYKLSVDVTEPADDGSGLPLPLVAGGIVVVALVVVVGYRALR